MRIAFFGTPAVAAAILEKLISAKHEIVCVVTQPDMPQGRGKKIASSPVKELAQKHGLPTIQPEKIKNNPEFDAVLKEKNIDVAVVAAYGKILPENILVIPKFGFINLHASLLPKYRGAAPVQWALINGEKESGMTIFKLVAELDAGPIIAQDKIQISDEDTTVTLLDKLFSLGGEMLLTTLDKLEKGSAEYLPQDEKAASFAPTLTKEFGQIDWSKNARQIFNLIRAAVPWPGANTYLHGKRLKILKGVGSQAPVAGKKPGEIIQLVKDQGFVVAAGNGALLITKVQLEGGKAMSAKDFLIGHDVKVGETLPN